MRQASACTAWSCELPLPPHPTEPCTGAPAPSVLLCRALGMGKVTGTGKVMVALGTGRVTGTGKVTLALETGKVMVAFPRKGARDVGNGHLAPRGPSPSAICISVSSPQYRGCSGCLAVAEHLVWAGGGDRTQAAYLGYPFPLPRQRLSPLAHVSICHPRWHLMPSWL